HANAKARLQVRNELDYYRSKQVAASLSLAVTGNARPLAISEQTAERVFQGELSKELLHSRDGEAGLSAASGTIEVVSPNSCLILLQQPDSIEKQVVSIQATDFLNPEGPRGWLLREWQQREVPVAEMTRFTKINQLSGLQSLAYYLARWREFLWESPREANNAGGIFPAIWGTVVLTLIMIVAVVPFGVMAALYLHEYTSSGPLVSLIRISINNLAGVPSIIYGVFGVAFFCYTMGAFIDGGPTNADIRPMPVNLWLLWLLAAFATGIAALSCTIRYAKRAPRRQVKPALPRWTLLLWLACFGMVLLLIFKNPLFEGFYPQQLPNPTFGKGGILWAALTLALLTLPIVIVSTEEALAAVPRELRDASAACGASKWQTIRRIVIPYATPGIMTGGILAMTRGVGQVAPLMLVGALPRAPELPLDTEFPFLHLSRSFMHLGYQVYAFGIQGQNTEATQPLVFTCILLLVGVVALLNMSANWMRSRMKQRIRTHQF
ncbi:MAG: ABC transporter permease subunit, partial [bacterium]|nr:ABC transporter permease subunit [bacterium]